jgi:hypothetical protein
MAAVLCAVLVCSDLDCAAVYEAWCEDCEVEGLASELCGCSLQPVSVSNDSANGALALGIELELRDAA